MQEFLSMADSSDAAELVGDLDFKHDDADLNADRAFNNRLKRFTRERDEANDHLTAAEKEARRKIAH
jgi:hypothetical protein